MSNTEQKEKCTDCDGTGMELTESGYNVGLCDSCDGSGWSQDTEIDHD